LSFPGGFRPAPPPTGRAVEADNVFTLELGVTTEAGFVGLEEDVPVTPQGCTFLSSFQRETPLVDPQAR
jgi:hypothetical protein